MWEDYLDRAAEAIPNKYLARRFRARVRGQLLREYAAAVDSGMVGEAAKHQAMDRLGDPYAVALRLTAPQQRQHGWLWSISVLELFVGLAIMMVSRHSEYFAGMALGRLVTIWGMIATTLHSRHPNRLRRALASLRDGARGHWSGESGRMVLRSVLVGAVSGVLAALFLIVPWNVINSNVIDPVVLSYGSMVVVAAAVAIGPLMARRSWRDQVLRSVACQAYAGLVAASTYTGVVWLHPGLMPPPFYNWNLPLMIVVGFAVYFGCIRLYRFSVSVRKPLESWAETEELAAAI